MQLLQGGELGGFVWAWQDIAGQETLIAWISQHDTCDEAFLTLLLSLRSHGISSASGHYLSLKITEIAHLFGGEKELRERLSRIEAEGQFPDQTDDINKAIAFSKSF